ncbi:SU10 major capsid protein [Halobacillus amylolyticus]|uniref:DUF5309 domain-containing protein n=1 Tax=Halobacillus amylolyticus TaxID=2932259 RepID=A0ABY4HD38_9BACI|nr:DUF5309 family protein [Halobacillus amylolyticus]UOR12183.1 DUF5309 domain-containing protein [Halobacillus amylolyticus]
MAFNSQDFVQGQSYDLSSIITEVNKQKNSFVQFLMSKRVKASNPQVHWITEEIADSAVTLAEGGDAPAYTKDTQTPLDNYLELFANTATVTNTAQASSAVGVSDLLTKEVEKKTKAIKNLMENKMIHGVKGYATSTYKTGGILEQVDAANKVTGTSLTKAKFESMLEAMYNAGVSDNMLVFLPANMKKLVNGFDSVEHYAREKFLGFDADEYITPYGNAYFTLCEGLGQDNMFVVNPDYVEFAELIPLNGKVEASSGSKQSVYIETQSGIKLLNPAAAASFKKTTA